MRNIILSKNKVWEFGDLPFLRISNDYSINVKSVLSNEIFGAKHELIYVKLTLLGNEDN